MENNILVNIKAWITAALAVLGYSPAEIAVALKGLDLEGLSLEEIVRQALRKMIK